MVGSGNNHRIYVWKQINWRVGGNWRAMHAPYIKYELLGDAGQTYSAGIIYKNV
jgi:hypothetical protein